MNKVEINLIKNSCVYDILIIKKWTHFIFIDWVEGNSSNLFSLEENYVKELGSMISPIVTKNQVKEQSQGLKKQWSNIFLRIRLTYCRKNKRISHTKQNGQSILFTITFK